MEDGGTFKATKKHLPYFYISTKETSNHELKDVEAYLMRRFQDQLARVDECLKEDLDLKNHVTGLRKSYLKLVFRNVKDLMDVRKMLTLIIIENRSRSVSQAAEVYANLQPHSSQPLAVTNTSIEREVTSNVMDVRESNVQVSPALRH